VVVQYVPRFSEVIKHFRAVPSGPFETIFLLHRKYNTFRVPPSLCKALREMQQAC
jgi:hypothetical protein